MTFVNKLKRNVNPMNVWTPAPPSTYSVGSVSAQVVAENTDRVGLIIVNLSTTNNVYLGLSYPAVLNSGVTLLPGLAWKLDEYTFFIDAVYAIADADGANISIQEFSQ